MKCALVCFALLACAHPEPKAPNDVFRSAYHEARARALASAGPVLLVDGDHLILIDGARREQVTIRDAQYHALKQAAHGPLGVFAALADVEGPLPAGRAEILRGLRGALSRVPAPAQEPGELLSPVLRAEPIETALTIMLLDRVLKDGVSRRADLDQWARTVGPQLLAAAQKAATLELEAIDAATKRWQSALGDRFLGVHVVVIGSHMARDHEIAVDYFLHMLGEQAEGSRVVYAESLWLEQQALDLLGTHLIDAEIGRAFFGDAMRMHRDLLSK
jgi:hypothetical protein